MLALYGHPFSSYTWKALIPLYANEIAFEFRVVGPDRPEHDAVVQKASPLGKFPVLEDGGHLVFEASSIVEYLAVCHGAHDLLPDDRHAALQLRKIDRVFDNYVMNGMQVVVDEYIRDSANPDLVRCEEARAKLTRTYRWLEEWLATYPANDRITLIECAAAPSLFYADWVHPIAEEFPRLRAFRAHLLALPAVKRCVDDARPFRDWFPLGNPGRD